MGGSGVPLGPQGETILGPINDSLKALEGTQLEPQGLAFARQFSQLKVEFKNLNNITGPQFTTAMLSLTNVLPGITSGALLAVEGFRDGDALSGSRGILDVCAALAPVISAGLGLIAGPEGGLVGYLVGSFVASIFNMAGDILGFFAPRADSLAKTVSDLLQKEKAEEAQKDIWKVHNSFWVYATALNTACSMMDSKLSSGGFRPGVTTKIIEELNLGEGNAIRDYWDVIGWLTKPDSQDHRLWPLVLSGACNAYAVLLVAIVRLKSIVSSTAMLEWHKNADADGKRKLQDLWDIAEAKLTLYGACNKLNLDQLTKLTPVALNRGTLWRITRNLEVGVMDPNISSVHHGGGFEFKKISVTVCSHDQIKPEPVYQLYGIEMGNKLVLWKVNSYKTGAKKLADWVETSTYLDDRQINDVFATPGTDLTKQNHACVYELLNGGLKIEGKYRDENGKAIETFCTFPSPESILKEYSISPMTSVRAVHDPYAYAEDGSKSHLKDIKSIVYALEGTGSRIICVLNGGTFTFVHSPFQQTRGIAVDQDYLWVFTDTEFACATHASVIHRVRWNREVDWWIKSTQIPDAKKGIHSVYPCDDGSLVAIVKDTFDVYSAPYRIDLQKLTITAYNSNNPLKWTKIRDYRAQSLEKLPVFCWPEFESLRETLETFQNTFGLDTHASA